MIRNLLRSRKKQILVDISTQRDLFMADGSACIRNHRRVLANVRRMVAWARHRDIPVISTCEVYPNNNGGRYCIAGTPGQRKIPYTLLSDNVMFQADNDASLPQDVLQQHRQIILQKRCMDPFEEPRIDRLFSEIYATQFILIGACAEGSVEATTLGLLQRGKKVIVVSDAVGSWDKTEAEHAFRKMKAKGAKMIDTKNIAGTSHLRQVGACDCERCRGVNRKTMLGPIHQN